MQVQASLVGELEAAIKSGSRDRRVELLRRITDLFLSGVNRLNDEQIDVFDDVLTHLAEKIEAVALRELSERLAPVDKAPPDVIRRLAFDDEIAVAAPVLSGSSRLSTVDLVQIAKTKSQAHLLAISDRPQLAEPVTDVLLDRGNDQVVLKLAANSGARFSPSAFASLRQRAEGSEELGEGLLRRLDLPIELFRELLLRATEAVRCRLLSGASPERQAEIHLVLANVATRVDRQAHRNYAEAMATVTLMHERRMLNEAAVFQFAMSGRYEQMVAAIAVSCQLPIDLLDRLMHGERVDPLFVLCKAAKFEWRTARAILRIRSIDRPTSEDDLSQAKIDYAMLTAATAQRVMRFWQVRETAVSAETTAA